MDCLLLLCHVDRTLGYDGRGDFRLGRDGRLTRQQGSGALAYMADTSCILAFLPALQ